MVKRRYIKKKKPNPDFPYKPIKDTLNWRDAQSHTGWLNFEQMKKLRPALSKSKGWIFEETDDHIKIFGTYSKDPDDKSIEFGEVICIPKNWI